MDQNVASLIKYQPIKVLDWGLNQLRSNVLHYGDFDVNLELEHLHSVVNHKQRFHTIL